jgi:Pyruvate/2-oxoacid:ferredoxin oxidoreductase delta subunit
MILYCDCACSNAVPEPVRQAVRTGLSNAKAPHVAVSDLCGLAAHGDPLLAKVASTSSLVIIACYPRAVRRLFEHADVKLPEGSRLLNMRLQSAEEILDQALSGQDATSDCLPEVKVEKKNDWVPWFPVFDRERCTKCRQCLNFCPFGVLSAEEGGWVQARYPERCKNLCPACARICPELAIIFPKHDLEPINGAEVKPEHLAARGVNPLQELPTGSELHTLLARRRCRCECKTQPADGTGISLAAEKGSETCIEKGGVVP